ncbi:MAG: hypothetical protein WCQ47_00570 [bacterium]
MKISQRVVYSGNIFNETIWFKNSDKFKVSIEKDGDILTLVRNGQKCIVTGSSSRVTSQDLCKKSISNNFYYSTLMPAGNLVNYMKSVGIKANYEQTEVLKDKDGYAKPSDVFMLRYDKTPIYVIGASESDYSSALSNAKGDKKNVTDKLLESLKEKSPQIWLDSSTNYPVRIYGEESDSGKKLEILFGPYTTDGNDLPFPSTIKFSMDGKEILSYGVQNFESNISSMDDQLFNVATYLTKFPKSVEESNLSENKKVLLNYLKEYR